MHPTSNSNIKNPAEPISNPYPAPFTIPVMLDDVKLLEEFNMSRCTFFYIESVGNLDNWVGYLRSQDVPFLLLGITAVLHRPDIHNELFRKPGEIEQLFVKVEDVDGLVVESEHIWLPNFLFKPYIVEYSQDNKTTPLERGAIWRVGFGLFQLALAFQRELIGNAAYTIRCQELYEGDRSPIEYSEEESIAFQAWCREQIEAARQNYLRQRDDESLGVLGYIDENGMEIAG